MLAITQKIRTTTTISTVKPMLTSNGANTNHQDQLRNPVILAITKMIVKIERIPNPLPPT